MEKRRPKQPSLKQGHSHGHVRQKAILGTERTLLLSIVVAVITTLFLSNQWWQSTIQKSANAVLPPISPAELDYGRIQCALRYQRPIVNHDLAKERLAARSRDGVRTVLVNATLIDGDGEVKHNYTIEMQGNIFTRASEDLVPSLGPDTVVIDLHGRVVTPGLIDMHSHAGVRETPQLWSTEDVTEISAQLTPWARAIDGLKPHDQAIQVIGSGGVTTSLVLTGAKNMISGEGVVIKMKKADSVRDLLINMTEHGGKPLRYLKMAMGENQKRQFGNIPGGPATRLGESHWFRLAYENARRVMREQDRWCESLDITENLALITDEYPRSLEWQTLVDVLRGDLRVNIHGYETEDVLAMFDHADEFDFPITALHHALHSDQLTEQIKERGIAVVGFSDSWGDKKELYNVSSYLPKRMADHSIPFALTRDHPAEHGQWLAYEAQIAHHFGLDDIHAISSIISEPARLLGLDNRLGFVRPGYDADLVVWDRHPLRVGATPLEVFIDGKSVVRASDRLWDLSMAPAFNTESSKPRHSLTDETLCKSGLSNMVVRGLRTSFVGDDGLRGDESSGLNMTAVFRAGRLVCVGEGKCDALAEQAIKEAVAVIDVQEGYMLPGLTIVTRQHGLVEMRQEPSTADGASQGEEYAKPLSSKFGIKFDGIHLQRAHRAGITRLVTPPITTGFFHGISTMFRPGAKSVLDTNAVVESSAALHFTVGHDGKNCKTPSITSQISALHDLLTVDKHIHPIYEKAARGELAVIVHTNNKDVIAHMIALKKQTGAHIVIMGGAEAHLVAAELADADMPVIFAPFWGCEPLTWESRNCLPGPPLTELFGPQVLMENGVTIAISNWDDTNNHIRNSIWEAAWIAGPGNESVALDLVSRNIEDFFRAPRTKDIVIYEGSPFEFGAKVAIVFEEGRVQDCYPDADE